jgi:hypothetical protein
MKIGKLYILWDPFGKSTLTFSTPRRIPRENPLQDIVEFETVSLRLKAQLDPEPR